MTEEEINKKAEKHCNEVLCNAHEKCNEVIKCRDWRSRRAGFFCGYEQALKDCEKENAELIQENEEMKKGLGCETCQIHLEYMSLNNRIDDLEKENAKLKKENKVLAQNLEDTEILNKTYEKKNKELKEKLNFSTQYYQGEKAKEQLTKSRELLKELVTLDKYYHWNLQLAHDAEQFLSEVHPSS